MDEDLARLIAQLHTAHEKGILDDVAFRAALTAVGATETFGVIADNSAIAQGGGTAVGRRGVAVGDVDGDVITGDHVVVVKAGGRVIVGADTVEEMTAVDRKSAVGRYLAHAKPGQMKVVTFGASGIAS
ncbi:MAG: hypothetical protein K1X50_01480 [Candidatus Promineofilum sp.]|nr:hypothetical protein [Promineifilum sp.]